MKSYLGVDWSAREVACALALGEKPPRKVSKGATRTLASVRDLIGRVRKDCPAEAELHVIIEAGANGWCQLFHAAGAVVHVVNTAQSAAFAASLCSSGAKDDQRDAALLASLGRSPDHCPPIWQPVEEERAQLLALSALHETLTGELTRAEQRLRCHLREQFPTLEAVIRDLSLGWVIRLLRQVPTPWHARQLTEADLRKLLEGSGSQALTRDRVIVAFAAAEAPWLTEGLARVQGIVIGALLDQVELFNRQIDAIDQQLDACTANNELRHTFDAVGGIGVKMANRLLRFAFGEIPKDRDQAGILLGVSPVFSGSAKTAKGRPKGKVVLRRSVDGEAQATGYLLGRLASQQIPWGKRMYADGRQRGQGAATIYRRIARSLLRIFSAMARTGQPYDDDRYEATLRTKGVPWALAA